MVALYDDETCDKARVSRDPRFDGLFFVGVRTTGIYCRPICPVKPAKRVNVEFYPNAAAAAEAGFRPCLRCRPEAAPGTPAWSGTAAVVSRALRLIDEGALDEGTVEKLASRVGLGARHLGRLFREVIGATPTQIARTRRLHFAKKLLDETRLPMSEIALSSGFGSIRRFNDALKATYGRTPSQLRKADKSIEPTEIGAPISLRLKFRPPHSWANFCMLYRAERLCGVETVSDTQIRCAVSLHGRAFLVEGQAVDSSEFIEARLTGVPPKSLAWAVAKARQVFDLDANPLEIEAALRSHQRIERVNVKRIPGVFAPFGYLVRTVVASHCGTERADRYISRLVQHCGEPAVDARDGLRSFPEPITMTRIDSQMFGLPAAAKSALSLLVAQEIDEPNRFELLPTNELTHRVSVLLGTKTKTDPRYVAMRLSGEPDAFVDTKTYAAGLDAGDRIWSPWSSYVHLQRLALEAT